MTTIHCLKSTALSWAGKAGLNAETREVLGHHSTGKHSHEIYNRDLLAEPIIQLELVLQRIRTGAFLPDASRSGMLVQPSKEDPSNSFRKADSTSDTAESSSADSSIVMPTLYILTSIRMPCMRLCLKKKRGTNISTCINIVGLT